MASSIPDAAFDSEAYEGAETEFQGQTVKDAVNYAAWYIDRYMTLKTEDIAKAKQLLIEYYNDPQLCPTSTWSYSFGCIVLRIEAQFIGLWVGAKDVTLV